MSHYFNQRSFIVNWTLLNIQQCNLNFHWRNAFDDIVCKTAAILSMALCDKLVDEILHGRDYETRLFCFEYDLLVPTVVVPYIRDEYGLI